jgi:hypothetical protein
MTCGRGYQSLYPIYIKGHASCWQHLPGPGRPVATFLLCLQCCVCVFSGNCLHIVSARPGVIFLRWGRFRPVLSCCIHPCLHILTRHAQCVMRPSLACVTTCMCTHYCSQPSDQLIPLHHCAHYLLYPACLFLSYIACRTYSDCKNERC